MPRSNGLVLVNYKISDIKLEGKTSVFNVSGTGIRLALDKKIKLGLTVEMEIFLPGDSQVISAIGDVVWVQKIPAQKYSHASIKFTVVSKKNRTRIIEYVDRKTQQHEQQNNH